jgi:hypothetical protein
MNPIQKKILHQIKKLKYFFLRILRPRTQEWDIESGYYRFPAVDLPKLWEEFYPKSANRRLTIAWWDSLFLKDTIIRFNESVGGRSTIQIGKKWKSSAGLSSLFFLLAESFMKKEESRWESILQEFSDYCIDPKKWDRFLRFSIFQNTFLPATSIRFDWGVLFLTKISYELAETFYLRRTVPSSLERGSVLLKICHLNLVGTEYPLYQEDFVLNGRNFWLRDFFLEVRSNDINQNEKPFFYYIGSQYSHSEVEKHCVGMKLHRKILPFDVDFSFPNPLLLVRFMGKSYQINDWQEFNFPENYGSRFVLARKKAYFNLSYDEEKVKLFLLPKGNYLLDKNLLDLPPTI